MGGADDAFLRGHSGRGGVVDSFKKIGGRQRGMEKKSATGKEGCQITMGGPY